MTMSIKKTALASILLTISAALAVLGAAAHFASGLKPTQAVPLPTKYTDKTEMYLNDAPFLTVSDTNPYRQDIIAGLNTLSSKPEAGSEEFCHTPELTVVDKKGNKFEYGLAVTAYSSPDVEGAESTPNTVAFYARSYNQLGEARVKYYSPDEDINKLRENIRNAVPYEYKRIGSFEGVVTYVQGKNINLYSEKYGYIQVFTNDAKNAIVGDTIQADYAGENASKLPSAKFMADVTNITQGDVTKTAPDYLTPLPFEYEVFAFENADKLANGYPEVITDKEELEFMFMLYGDTDKMPSDVISKMTAKYDENFFADNILLFVSSQHSDAEVKAAVMANWTGDPDILYIKDGKDNNPALIAVSVERMNWDEEVFEKYIIN